MDIIRIDLEVQDSTGDSASLLRVSAGGHFGQWRERGDSGGNLEGSFSVNQPQVPDAEKTKQRITHLSKTNPEAWGTLLK